MSDIGCFLVLNGYGVSARHLGGRQRGSAADLKFLNRKRRGFEVGKTLAVETLAVETWGVETDHELGTSALADHTWQWGLSWMPLTRSLFSRGEDK
jgi:hypothetical protein